MEKRDNIVDEAYITENPFQITIEGVETIYKQMKQSIFKIYIGKEKEGTGFFCKFPCKAKNNFINAFFTNSHILNKNEITNKKPITISFYLNNEKIFKEIILYNSRYFIDEQLDITIVELGNSQINENYEFLELDKDINQEKKYLSKIYKSLYVLHYPKKGNIISSFGLFKEIKEQKEIFHNCCTDSGSSGSPILSLETNKVIGIHRGYDKNNKLNIGTLLSNLQNLSFCEPYPNNIPMNIKAKGNRKYLKSKKENNQYEYNHENNKNIDFESKEVSKNNNKKNNISNLNGYFIESKEYNNINNNLVENKIDPSAIIYNNINLRNKGIQTYNSKNNPIKNSNNAYDNSVKNPNIENNNNIKYNNNSNGKFFLSNYKKKDNPIKILSYQNNERNNDNIKCDYNIYNLNSRKIFNKNVECKNYNNEHNNSGGACINNIYNQNIKSINSKINNNNQNAQYKKNSFNFKNKRIYEKRDLNNYNGDYKNQILQTTKNNKAHTLQKSSNYNNNFKKDCIKIYDKQTLENGKYEIIKQIGEGSFGRVYLIKDKLTNLEYALKQIIIYNKKNTELKYKEIFEKLSSLEHPNIIKIYNTELTENNLKIFMERGIMDWDKEIEIRRKNKKYYTEEEIFNILKQLSSGLRCLQENKITHRDIKPNNILIFPEKIYKIADLGEGTLFSVNNKRKQVIRGSIPFMSPVLYNGLNGPNDKACYNPFKNDVFSLGFCFLYAMNLKIDILNEIRKIKYSYDIKNKLGKYLEYGYSKRLINIITDMIEYEEDRRCDFIELDKKLDKIIVR